MGIPIVAEPLDRAAIINRTLIAGGSFDLYLLDWRFPLYPGYLCDLFYSANDTILTGNYNTTGYNNPEFDALCDLFLAETDPRLAQKQAFQMQALLAEDIPYIPLYNPLIVDLIHDRVMLPYFPELGGVIGNAGFQTSARVLME
jgi:ABC-type transport system substrate-binding protein